MINHILPHLNYSDFGVCVCVMRARAHTCMCRGICLCVLQVLAIPVTALHCTLSYPYVGAGDSNSDPHAPIASTLLTEPSPLGTRFDNTW